MTRLGFCDVVLSEDGVKVNNDPMCYIFVLWITYFIMDCMCHRYMIVCVVWLGVYVCFLL